MAGTNSYTGATLVSGNSGGFQLGTGSSNATLSSSSITINNSSQFAIDITGTTTISGTIMGSPTNTTNGYAPGSTLIIGALVSTDTVSGTGTVILTANNTYGGNTLIETGTLQIGNGGTTGALPSTTLVSGSTGTGLVFDRSDNIVVGGTINGALNVTQLGGGMLTLTASNGYTGTTTIASGTLQLGNGSVDSPLSSVALVNSGAVIFNTLGSQNYAGNISGVGSLTKLGVGNQKISGNNSYSGSTIITSGTLQLGSSTALGNTSGVNVAGTAALNLSNGTTVQTTTLSGAGTTLTLNDGSTLVFGFSGTNSDQLFVTNGAALSLTGQTNIDLNLLSGTGGTFVIITDTNGFIGTGSFALGPLPPLTSNGSIVVSGSTVTVSFSGVTTIYWSGAGDDQNFTNFANYTSDSGGTTPINGQFGAAQTVVFSGSNAQSPGFVVLDQSITIKNLVISDTNSVNITTFGGTTLTLASSGITTTSGAAAATINASVAFTGTSNITVNNIAGLTIGGIISGNTGVIINGSNTLALTGANTYSGGVRSFLAAR